MLEDAVDAATLARARRRDRAVRPRGARVPRTQPDGRFSIAGRRHRLDRDPPRDALDRCCATSARRRCSPTSATISSAPTSASTGTRRSTSSRTAPSRSCGTRTTATPTSSRRRTSRAGSRSPTRRSTTVACGSSPACTARHARAPRHPDRLPVLRGPARARSPSRCKAGSIVVFSSLTPHTTGLQHDRRRAQGLHRAVRPRRRRRAAGRSRARLPDRRCPGRSPSPVPRGRQRGYRRTAA